MSDTPQQTPLVDLLRDVPKDLRAEWPIQWSEDGRETGHSIAPIGKYCHDAVDKIAELEQQLAEAQKLVEATSRDCNATALERNKLRGQLAAIAAASQENSDE